MYRDVDPRPDEPERADLSRGGRGGSRREPRRRQSDDPRDVFSRDLDLPRGPTRERVVVRSHEYTLRGSEVRTLATTGAFRVVPAEELRRPEDRPTVLGKDLDRFRDRGPGPDDALRRRTRAHEARDAHRSGPRRPGIGPPSARWRAPSGVLCGHREEP